MLFLGFVNTLKYIPISWLSCDHVSLSLCNSTMYVPPPLKKKKMISGSIEA